VNASLAGQPFTSAGAAVVLEQACAQAAIRSEGAELLRMGENALFRLPQEQIVVRIARGPGVLEDAKKEVAVATWLRDAGLPAAATTAHSQPIMVQSRPVTFWKLIEDSGIKATLVDLAGILQALHSLSIPPNLVLPKLDIFDRVAERITREIDIPEAERSFLAGHLGKLRQDYANLRFRLPQAAVHGDAHQGNLIVKPDGEAVLIDFERFAFGQPESDLSVTATEYLVGWHADEEYAQFCDAYGFDVMSWDGFPVIRAINELKMTTWLMQNVRHSEQIAQEAQNRLASLHDPDAPRSWRPF
jgi:phosphotransferase family enzyme